MNLINKCPENKKFTDILIKLPKEIQIIIKTIIYFNYFKEIALENMPGGSWQEDQRGIYREYSISFLFDYFLSNYPSDDLTIDFCSFEDINLTYLKSMFDDELNDLISSESNQDIKSEMILKYSLKIY